MLSRRATCARLETPSLLSPAVASTSLLGGHQDRGSWSNSCSHIVSSLHTLWATHGGWEHGFGAIETWVCVLAPICASVSSAILTLWDGTELNSCAEVRLERRDVPKALSTGLGT